MIDAKRLSGLDGMEYVASVPDGEIIIGLQIHEGKLFVATSSNIYLLRDEKRLEIVEEFVR